MDAATDEQASKQPVLDKPEDEPSDDLNPDDDVLMDTTEDLNVCKNYYCNSLCELFIWFKLLSDGGNSWQSSTWKTTTGKA